MKRKEESSVYQFQYTLIIVVLCCSEGRVFLLVPPNKISELAKSSPQLGLALENSEVLGSKRWDSLFVSAGANNKRNHRNQRVKKPDYKVAYVQLVS